MPQVLGNWILREPINESIWSDWSFGQHRQSNEPAWLRWIPARQLETPPFKLGAPSLERLRKYAHLNSPFLQNLIGWHAIDNGLLLAVQPLEGELLSNRLNQRLAPEEVLAIVRQCIGAIQSLHAAGLVHGRILPDRLYVGPEQKITLVCDPICRDTTRTATDNYGLLRSNLPKGLFGTHFLAPEFLVPNFTATKSTDIYAMGCLWWLLQFGRPPVPGGQDQEILIAQAQRRRDTVWKSELPEPLAKCMRYCLAKNPNARFTDANALRSAFEQSILRSNIVLDSPHVPLQVTYQENVGQESRFSEAHTKPPTRQAMELSVSVPQSDRKSLSTSTRRQARRKRAPQWLLPATGGGIIVVVLSIFFFNGFFGPKQSNDHAIDLAGDTRPPATVPTPVPVSTDPRADQFEIVAQTNDVPWLPPTLPSPIHLDLLPHGGQLFLAFRPRQIWSQATTKQLLALFDSELVEYWKHINELAGIPFESIDSITLAVYPGQADQSMTVLRVRLATPRSLSDLRARWKVANEAKHGDQTLLISTPERAYFVPNQPLASSQSVSEFAVGPVELMQESAQVRGIPGPLNAQIERLLEHTDVAGDLSILLSPPYLFGDGRSLIEQRFPELQSVLQQIIGGDVRAAACRVSFEPTWYIEARLIGTSDRDAGRLSDQLKRLLASSESAYQQRIVSHVPHTYWRELAFKFPRMLEIMSRYSRIGIEDGEVIINAYLPSHAAPNMLVASWLALSDLPGASDTNSAAGTTNSDVVRASDIEAYLNRPITLRFDQEAIEVALQLIADEANEGLPAGSTEIRFELDGGAFEKNGITRNQQIRDFQHNALPVRDALTALAKRGNPDPSVTDLRHENQKLVWLVKHGPSQSVAPIISLTTRDAAKAANVTLPREFVAN